MIVVLAIPRREYVVWQGALPLETGLTLHGKNSPERLEECERCFDVPSTPESC